MARLARKSVGLREQEKALHDVREVRPEYKAIHTHLLQDALTRLDRAFSAFFRRAKSGEKPGFPRFKGRGRYRTFTFKDAPNGNGVKLIRRGRRVRLAGIGEMKVKLHRPWEGVLKQVSVTLSRDDRWYVALACDDVPAKPLPPTGEDVGIDLGISTFATLSDGSVVENPRHLAQAEGRLQRAQRVVSRRRRGSSRRRKAVRLLARRHERVRAARLDFHHKAALELVRHYDRIAVEDLNVKGLARTMLAKPVHDAGWAQFTAILASKAESAGRELVKVRPSGTTQACSVCGVLVPKTLAQRVHRCPDCGYVADRDLNAARNVLLKGLGPSLRGGDATRRPDDPRSPLLSTTS